MRVAVRRVGGYHVAGAPVASNDGGVVRPADGTSQPLFGLGVGAKPGVALNKRRKGGERRRRLVRGADASVKVPLVEQLLVDACADVDARSVLCTSVGFAQLAAQTAARLPAARVYCHFLDLYAVHEARALYAAGPANLEIVCAADPPVETFDLALVPVTRRGEAELVRDLLQLAYERLRDGGRLVTAVDNREDKWLHEELQKLCPKVSVRRQRGGVVYMGVRKGPLKRRRDFACEFAFRDRGRLIRAVSRPGVFSHRELDLGARALIEAMEVEAGERVLDMGCGSGVVGFAAALRAERVTVHAIDSHARAIECTEQGAALNGLADRVTTQLDAEGAVPEPGTFDLVAGNAPYYSHFKIADIFVQSAKRSLKPGGRVLLVTKEDEWHRARLGQLFTGVESREVRGYRVVIARQPS